MVPRYARPAMTAIWEPEARYRIWFEIEAHATQKLGELGVVPAEAGEALWAWWSTDPTIDVEAIDAIEAVTKHDVIAFLTWVSEQVAAHSGQDWARFMHQGMTSSDVLDTTLAVQLARATDLLLEDMDGLLAALRTRAMEHKYTPTIGRSHGIHAEPVTFGLKLAQAYAEFERCRARLWDARAEIATCAISGAVGTFANIDPEVEAYVAEKLGLVPETDLHSGHPARPSRDVFRHAGGHRRIDRADRGRDPPSPAHRGARSGGIFLARAERFERHAAQAQPDPDRKPHRSGAHDPRLRPARARERRAVARARYLAFLGRALHRPRRHRHARFRTRAAHRGDREAAGLPRSGCRRTWTAWAGWCIRSACCWR